MARLSKRRRENDTKHDAEKVYEIAEAFSVLKAMRAAKFDETVEVAIRLGVDPKQSDQMVRGVVRMPHGTGKAVRVLVFASGEKAQEAQQAGADYVGTEDLVDKIKGGWLEFDKAIATPDQMGKVGGIARILGPRGLMPNPKTGTVTQDVGKAVREEKAGRVDFRVEKAAIVHAPVGRLSFSAEQLVENFRALIEQVLKQKPSTSKGIYLQKVCISSTMGPGIKVDVSPFQAST